MIGTLQLSRALTNRDLSDQLLARGVETAMKLLTTGHDPMADGPPAANARAEGVSRPELRPPDSNHHCFVPNSAQ